MRRGISSHVLQTLLQLRCGLLIGGGGHCRPLLLELFGLAQLLLLALLREPGSSLQVEGANVLDSLPLEILEALLLLLLCSGGV